MTTLTAALNNAPGLGQVAATLGKWFSSVSWMLEFSGRANELAREYEHLSAKSDADLEERGLTREGLVREVFGELLDGKV